MKMIFWVTGLVLITLSNYSCKSNPKNNNQNVDTTHFLGGVENPILNGDSIVLEYQNLNNQLDNLLALRREKIDSIRILQLQIFPQKKENPKPKLKEVKSQNTDDEIEFIPDNGDHEYTQIFEDRKPIDTSKFLRLIKNLGEDLKRISADSSIVENKLEALYKRMPLRDIENYLSKKYLAEASKNYGMAKTSETFSYTGDRESDFGGSNHYELSIKKDFSAAAFNGGPFYRLELLSSNMGLYQFVEGSVIGLRLQPSRSTCTVYNFDNSLFCVLIKK